MFFYGLLVTETLKLAVYNLNWFLILTNAFFSFRVLTLNQQNI